MKNKIKQNWWYIIVFIIVFVMLNFLGFCHNYNDPMNNYGFAYAIARGEIPYLDFNTVSTPLFAFYTSLGLHLFNNYVMFLLEQSLLVTITFYFLYQLFGKKSFLMLLVTTFFFYVNIIATYNYMCFFMLILLIYLENKYPNKDYFIGFCIGLALLSKQTVGFFAMIPTLLFYYKNIYKLGKRLIGFCIPCMLFLIYLLMNHCFYQFMDLCFFGLFDFLTNNGIGAGKVEYSWLILTIICFIIMIGMLIKHKKDINIYYLLCGVLFAIPIFDFSHCAMFFNCFVIMFLPYISWDEKWIVSFSCIFSVIASTILFIVVNHLFTFTFTSKLHHLNYNIHGKKDYHRDLKYNQFLNQYPDVIVVGYFAMKYDIMNDRDITYFGVPFHGNFGYHGNQKMIQRIERMHNQTFAVSKEDCQVKNKFDQFATEIADYIIKNSEKIDSKYEFDIYYKK